ncbi:MAG: mobile mystery protein B [Hyphomicrobiales bacterium]|nr:MAG: mobile mystery protein B [Hyphomicrobiales bacterium]
MIDLAQIEGATPLGPDDLRGLKQSSITTQGDLNLAEEANILAALTWTRRRRRASLLTRDFLLDLHRRMFGDVWDWAGQWRRRETNIGVAPSTVPMRTEALLQDAAYWVANTTYQPDELAIRFHHQLVLIHPFPNGNGRHSRLMADLLAEQLAQLPFSWGGMSLVEAGDTRRAYIDALRHADRGDIAPLLGFARA